MSGAGTAAYLLRPARIVPEYRMSFFSLRGRASAALMIRALAAGLVLFPAAGLPAAANDMISVNVDQAKLVKFPEKIATIVVGNPLIADVTLQPGGMVVVTGKGYGATNVIALDRSGAVLMDRVVQVEGPTDKVVTVYRGMARESYSCTPECAWRRRDIFQVGNGSSRRHRRTGSEHRRCNGDDRQGQLIVELPKP
jgi:Pilus formation protein N terminal region